MMSEKKQWRQCLEFIGGGIWKFEFEVVNSTSGGVGVHGALACVCWPVDFPAEERKCCCVPTSRSFFNHLSEYPSIAYSLPPHGLCRVVDVKLQEEDICKYFVNLTKEMDDQVDISFRSHGVPPSKANLFR